MKPWPAFARALIPPAGLACVAGLVLGLTGCGKGEDIMLPVHNVGCNRPPDPNWQIVVPLCGDSDQQDGVWLPDDTVVVVGSGGLVLTYDGEAWRRDVVCGGTSLHAVCATAGGTVVAAGDRGRLAIRSGAVWHCLDTGSDETFTAVDTLGETVWAVGYGGRVVRAEVGGDADTQWEALPAPAPVVLTAVHCAPDTVFVAGEDGRIHAWDGGAWRDTGPRRWGTRWIDGLAALPDGRLLAAADTLFVRADDHWEPLRSYGTWIIYGLDGLQTSANQVWLESGPWVAALVPRGNDWGTRSYGTIGQPGHCASRDTNNVLVFSEEGGLVWRRTGTRHLDPAGLHSDLETVTFDDGEVLVSSDLGVFALQGNRLVDAGLAPAVDSLFDRAQAVAGASRMDYYLLDYGRLYHGDDQVCNEIHEFADGNYGLLLARDPADGRLIIAQRYGLWSWDGTDLRLDLGAADAEGDGASRYQVMRTASGAVVAWNQDRQTYLREGDQWRRIGLYSWIEGALQLPGGPLVCYRQTMVNDDSRTQMITLDGLDEPTSETLLELSPACPVLTADRIIDHATGIYVFSEDNTLVFRTDVDPRLNRWDLVAGPVPAYLEYPAVCPDGSLLAADANDGRLYLYPAAPARASKERP